ncbi:MAG TPA: hypothetical protein VFA75_00230 [Nevskia sp.]|nr:hypothetical protein [Nevskia sp.]
MPLYLDFRAWLLQNDPDAEEMLHWCQNDLVPPATPEAMAGEIIWVILCAGRSAQAARTIEARVRAALNAGRPVVEVFGYRAKAAAIERAWRERQQDFASLQLVLARHSGERLVEWCGDLPFIGDDTKFQLAKNWQGLVCKPDIWICRLTGIPDRPRRSVKLRFPACMALCQLLAEGSGDSIATVDSLLWLGANKGVLQVDASAGPIRFVRAPIRARSILEPAAPAATCAAGQGELFGP